MMPSSSETGTSSNSNESPISQDDRERVRNYPVQVKEDVPFTILSETADGSVVACTRLRHGPNRIAFASPRRSREQTRMSHPPYPVREVRRFIRTEKQAEGSPINFKLQKTSNRGIGVPLHAAVSHVNRDLIALLLKHGADPNCLDNTGTSPLHMATAMADASLVSQLLEAGADVTLTDHKGNTPLKMAHIRLSYLLDKEDTGVSDVSKTKEELQSIIDMLIRYLQEQKKTEADKKLEIALAASCSRLNLSHTPSEVKSDVKNLLATLDDLTTDNRPMDCEDPTTVSD